MNKKDPFLKIKNILKDFKPSSNSVFNNNVVLYEELKIPPHIIRIAFGAIDIYPIDFSSAGLTWSLFFTYNKSPFMIRWGKLGLALCGIKENISQKEIILKKINNSAEIIDSNLKNAFIYRINEGSFLIYNTFRELMDVYTHYIHTIRSKIIEGEKISKKWNVVESKRMKTGNKNTNAKLNGIVIKEDKEFGKFLSKLYFIDNDITYFTISLMFIFISLCEVIFSTFYVLQKDKLESNLAGKTSYEKFKSFSNLKWEEKFKFVIDLDEEKDLRKAYNQLLAIKKNRNNIIHGMFGKENYCVKVEKIGIVPISYRDFFSHPFSLKLSVDRSKSNEIIDTFSEALLKLTEIHPYDCFFHFLINSLFIPFDNQEVSKIKNKMKECKKFREEYNQVGEYNQEMNLL